MSWRGANLGGGWPGVLPMKVRVLHELRQRRQRTTRQLIELLSEYYGREIDRRVMFATLWRMKRQGHLIYIPLTDETGFVSRWKVPEKEET